MPIPAKIAKESESSHQVAFFAYCVVAHNHGFDVADRWAKTGEIDPSRSKPLGCLEWIHHVPNGGSRGDDARTRKIRGARLMAEGVKKGIPDICLPWPIKYKREWFHMLYIEMKRPELKPNAKKAKGGLSDEQIEFRAYSDSCNIAFEVAYTWEEAVRIVKSYVNSNENK